MTRISKIILSIILLITLASQGFFIDSASADNSQLQSQIDADNQQIQLLTAKIAQYQAALQQIGADKKTLQAAISALDLQRSKVQAQVAITQHQIDATQAQIQQLSGQISVTQNNISEDQLALMSYLQNKYCRRGICPNSGMTRSQFCKFRKPCERKRIPSRFRNKI